MNPIVTISSQIRFFFHPNIDLKLILTPLSRYVESDDDSEDDIASAKQRGKMGISSTNNDEQKSALLWALLASYLPSGKFKEFVRPTTYITDRREKYS